MYDWCDDGIELCWVWGFFNWCLRCDGDVVKGDVGDGGEECFFEGVVVELKVVMFWLGFLLLLFIDGGLLLKVGGKMIFDLFILLFYLV